MDLNGDGHLDAIYNLSYLRAVLPGGGFGVHQNVSGQIPDPASWYFFDLPSASLVRRGLPPVFSQITDSSGNNHIVVQSNKSK